MAKRKNRAVGPQTQDELLESATKLMDKERSEDRGISISLAQIKDDFCFYHYEITGGRSNSFKHKVDGKGLIMDDIRTAFSRLNVHLAVRDDIYKHSKIDIDDIDTMHNDELAMLYHVTQIKIQGGEENESVILIGSKYLGDGARMELESPKISLESTSSYKWYNELKAAVDECRRQVALYHYGYFTQIQTEEPEEKLKQVKMKFIKAEGEDDTSKDEVDEEFENAKV